MVCSGHSCACHLQFHFEDRGDDGVVRIALDAILIIVAAVIRGRVDNRQERRIHLPPRTVKEVLVPWRAVSGILRLPGLLSFVRPVPGLFLGSEARAPILQGDERHIRDHDVARVVEEAW